jgi:uncharacterized OB-fold protein
MKVEEKLSSGSKYKSSEKYYNDKWFRESPQGVSLIGTKCKSCGMSFFPPKQICIRCHHEDVEEFELSKNGKLFTYTKVFIPSKHFNPPYVIGYIDLPEGIRIFSQVQDWEKCDLELGMEMEMTIDTLWESHDGTKIIGYKFRPVKKI